jgi:PTS system N-acetylgalactosamine-specific IIC component
MSPLASPSVCRCGTDGDYLPVLRDVRRDVPLRSHGGQCRHHGIERVNYLALLALGIFYFLCAFLPIYFGAEHAKTAIDVLPERLIDGLGVAGGIMPAIGFAVLLKIMMKNVYIPYFIIGFVAAAWLKLPVLAIAAAALAMALIDLLRKSPEPTAPAAQKEEFEDGI